MLLACPCWSHNCEQEAVLQRSPEGQEAAVQLMLFQAIAHKTSVTYKLCDVSVYKL